MNPHRIEPFEILLQATGVSFCIVAALTIICLIGLLGFHVIGWWILPFFWILIATVIALQIRKEDRNG